MPKIDRLDALVEKMTALETFTNSIEQRITRIQEKLALMDGHLAGLDLNVNRKLVEIGQTLSSHGDPLEAIATEVKGLRQERAAQISFNRRADHQIEAIAKKVRLNLSKIDAEA